MLVLDLCNTYKELTQINHLIFNSFDPVFLAHLILRKIKSYLVKAPEILSPFLSFFSK
jgi:hypothetical protein